ncbi:hypothetical protein OSB04_030099 [Centaurea solstitialis]|uniref:Uncharacterized protein n=1 Tax=Centaurea solstitialis TaxID=347529 RepID=A0AA38W6T3_9ASTR|nr:hypothetical protein OSB04_030099 [Centaurea solstitialis]
MENKSKKKEINRGAWTAEEDEKLAETIQIHGPRKWTAIAAKAEVWEELQAKMAKLFEAKHQERKYIRPRRDLIIRLHKLLGNRWSLIAGRLPGRTDNEIKNYWNSHLSKKKEIMEKQTNRSTREGSKLAEMKQEDHVATIGEHGVECSKVNFNIDEFFDFSNEDPTTLDWVNRYLAGTDSVFLS